MRNPDTRPWTGVVSAVGAYLTWGLSPIYFKALQHVAPLEILMHRMIWSLLLLLPLVILSGRTADLAATLKNRRLMAVLLATTIIVGGNWFLFIWAITTDRILQTSLGYYINPLVNVLLGRVFLGERLRPLPRVAVLIAGCGVAYLTFRLGRFPWVAIALALSFGAYGLVRKVAPVGALVGLTTELLLLFVPAALYVAMAYNRSSGAFLRLGWHTDLLLAGCAVVTGLPLLLFIAGARRLQLSTMGFLQYIAPSCTFLLAVLFYGEPMGRPQLAAFGCIWTALILFSFDSLRHHSRSSAALQSRR